MTTVQTSHGPDGMLVERLFKVRPGEGAKVLAFVLLAALLQSGIAIGITAADALFIANVGVAGLPAVYMLVPVMMLVYVPLTSWMLGRFGVHRVLQVALLVLASGAGVFFIVFSGADLGNGSSPAPYYAAKLFATLWYIALYSLFWNFADSFFDLQDAKRIFALFSAGSAVGSIVGGALVATSTSAEGLRGLYLIWSAVALLTLPLVSVIMVRFRRLEEWMPEIELGFGEQWAATRSAFRESSFLRYLMLALVISLVLTTVVEYQYLGIFSRDRSEVELAALIGGLYALANVFNLAVTLVVFSRLVLRVGVSNVALIQPVIYVVAFLLLLLQGGMPAAVFGFFAYQGILTSIEFNNQNFLFRAVPARVKNQVRTAIEGFAEPIATALGGLVLFLLAERLSPLALSSLGLVVGLAYLAAVLQLRVRYIPSIVRNLRQGWLDLSVSPPNRMASLDAADLALLRAQADPGQPDDRAQAALRVLWLRDVSQAAEATLHYLASAPTTALEPCDEFITQLVTHGTSAQLRELFEWAHVRFDELPPGLLTRLGTYGLLSEHELGEFEESTDLRLVSAWIVGVWHSPHAQIRAAALARLDHLLRGDAPEITEGLRVVAALEDESLAHHALGMLTHSDPEVRHEAFLALEASMSQNSTSFVPFLLEALGDADDGDRVIALRSIGKVRDPESVPELLQTATDFSPTLRRQVLQVLDALGPRGVPACVQVLRDRDASLEARLLAARGLTNNAPAQLASISGRLVVDALSEARQARHAAALLAGSVGAAGSAEEPGLAVLRRIYIDRQASLVDFVLEVLSLEGRLPDFELLAASLRSGHARERANALETIEEGVSGLLYRQLVDLLTLDAQLQPTDDEAEVWSMLHHALQAPYALEAAAATQSLHDRAPGHYRAVFRDRLTKSADTTFRQTVLQLASRDLGEFTPIEELAELIRTPLFARLPVRELAPLLPATSIRDVSSGTVISDSVRALDCLVIPVGSTRIFVDGQPSEPGAPVGLPGVFGHPEHVRVHTDDGRVVMITLDALRSHALASSRIATELLTYCTGAGHVAGL